MREFERLWCPAAPICPECRCGKEMHIAHIVSLPNEITTHIRVYECAACDHQMRLTVWEAVETNNIPAASNQSGPPQVR